MTMVHCLTYDKTIGQHAHIYRATLQTICLIMSEDITDILRATPTLLPSDEYNIASYNRGELHGFQPVTTYHIFSNRSKILIAFSLLHTAGQTDFSQSTSWIFVTRLLSTIRILGTT